MNTTINKNSYTTMNAIHWPTIFLPGTTDNYVSNEVIVTNISLSTVWELLTNADMWPTYYHNSSDIKIIDSNDTHLVSDTRFFFKTFGFPVDAKVVEYVEPTTSTPGRISWHGWSGEKGATDRLDVIHAWLVEKLPHGAIRILTQESQIGNPAKELHLAKPNPMLNGHQDWLDGLVQAAQKS